MQTYYKAIALITLFIAFTSQAVERLTDKDTRQRLSSVSPQLLRAVGRLTVTQPNKVHACSATLIDIGLEGSQYVLTSQHCLRPNAEIIWQTTDNNRVISRTATIELTNSQYDWALLKLSAPVSPSVIQGVYLLSETTIPIINWDSPYEYDSPFHTDAAEFFGPEEWELFDNLDAYYWDLYVAGYSADLELGDNGQTLTYAHYDENVIRPIHNTSDGFALVKAMTFEGASGGAVLMEWRPDSNNDDYGDIARPVILIGVIKGALTDTHVSKNGAKGSSPTQFSHPFTFTVQIIEHLRKKHSTLENLTFTLE